jgi:hypothetical protein
MLVAIVCVGWAVIPRRSAVPEGAGPVVTSISLNRSLVTGVPVLLVYWRLTASVPRLYVPVPLKVSV